MQAKQIAMKVSLITIIVNFVLSAFKLAAGIIAGSGAMISDAVHSASDVFSTVIVMIGIKIADKKPDDNHEYGHERIECVAAIILAFVLAITGIGIALDAVSKIKLGINGELAVPGTLALVAAIVSIIVKEIMFRYTKHYAKKINSGAMMADAWHHRSDALSSVGSLIGVGGAMLGFPILDPIAGIIICLFILKAAFDITKDAVNKMIDTACDKKTEDEMRQKILQTDGVLNLDDLKTRLFGNKIYIDVEIACDGNLTLTESHKIAEEVHLMLENSFENVKHCTVHVNPQKPTDDEPTD